MKKRVVVLGSTGVIGKAALAVVRAFPDLFKVVGLACRRGEGEWQQQLDEFQPEQQVVTGRDGEAVMAEMVTQLAPEVVVVGVVGTAGILPTLAGLAVGSRIALATKEVLVVAGEVVMQAAEKSAGGIVPVDSEHAAVFMALQAGTPKEIKQLYLTMGKGKLALMNTDQLSRVKPDDLWQRAVWPMGKKIAVDSATGMNKAFEVIEACRLFGVKPEQVKIVVHPEYVCHSAVEWVDGSVLAELGQADMYRYVHYALHYPNRHVLPPTASEWSLFGASLTFEHPNTQLFPAVTLGHLALSKGGTTAAFLHGADRAAVEAFNQGRIRFTEIGEWVDRMVREYAPHQPAGLDDCLEEEARGYQVLNQELERQ